jgi:UDP-N-acetylglucosamine 2-epimerase (non-hydrolysing)
LTPAARPVLFAAVRAICVAGARPNFVKVAPLWRALAASPRIRPTFVHTGQHYDDVMSDVFLRQLGLPRPHFELAVGSASHARQTAAILTGFEPVLAEVQPHVVIVAGDVNSTLACALAAAKFVLDRPFACALDGGPRTRPIVAHVEAGLRSGDRDMPEEHNRRVTDALADLLFATEAAAVDNLRREGVAAERIHLVGNLMIDSLLAAATLARTGPAPVDVAPGYLLLTLHRPANVDDPATLRALLAAVAAGAGDRPVLFPVHPRTRARLDAAGVALPRGWHVVAPLGYLEFVRVMADAALVCTDSGGIQEVTTVLGVACVTLRDTTERPVTLAHRNRLAGTEPAAITAAIRESLASPPPPAPPPPLWDGQAAPRVVRVLEAVIPAATEATATVG